MTKKKKIIISIISVVMAITLITTALIVILSSKFKVKNFDEIDYAYHTSAKSITLDNQYKRTFLSTFYENGTELIQNNDNKYGLFSNVSGQIVVETRFDRQELLHTNSETNKSYFKFYNSAKDSDGFVIYDESGKLVFDTQIKNYYPIIPSIEIKTKKIDVDNKYKVEESKENISVSDITFGSTYFKENEYHYESWIITDNDGIEYTNLYKIEDDKKELVTTIGFSVGNQIDDNKITPEDIYFLKNGQPVFLTEESKVISSNNKVLEIKIFNKDLELENKITIEDNVPYTKFRVGNYLYLQYVNESNEDDYDFMISDLGENVYYKLTTHKINLKSGKHSEISSKILALNAINTTGSLNSNITDINNVILNAYIIENKEIKTPVLMLVDDDLNHKEISYKFDSITKISKKRFLVHDTTSNDYMLIDKNYDIVADLSNFNNVFATEENLIVSDSNYTYICNHDGVVIKRYAIGNILNVHNSNYYMVLEYNEDNNSTTYRRGSNGKEFEIILTLSDSDNDTIKENLSFTNINTFVGSNYAYILAGKVNGSNTEYSIFNFDGTVLHTFTIPTQFITPQHITYDDNIVIKLADQTILLNR